MKRAKRRTARRTAAKSSPKTARRRGARKAAKKKSARRAPKQTAKRATRRAGRKVASPVKKSARRAKTVARRGASAAKPRRAAAAKPRTTVAIRRTGVRTPGRHAELKVVFAEKPKKPAKKLAAPKPRPFAGAMENATAKDLAIFDLVRARVEVQAAIQGLQPAVADQPVEDGKWSPREIVLHLHYWDREMLPYVERAWRHDERPPHTKDQILAENGEFLGELGRHDWDEARRLLQHTREQFLEELQSVPEEPAAMWSSEGALGWLIRILSHHDRHHAAVIKNARSRPSANATESS
jgi:hypothetical protein